MSFDEVPICHDGEPAKKTVKVDMETLKVSIKERTGLELIKDKIHAEEPRHTRVWRGSTDTIPGLYMSRPDCLGIIVKTWTTVCDRPCCRRDQRAERDIGALKWLNKQGCQYVPKYICSFKIPDMDDDVEHVLVMEKVAGITLSDYGVGYAYMSVEEKKTVRKAFEIAVRAVAACEVYNASPFDRNVLWNAEENKCYIIDYERAEFGEVEEKKLVASYWGFCEPTSTPERSERAKKRFCDHRAQVMDYTEGLGLC